ncbi:MAG: membrane protein insertase YidC [Alistipes senegalensis]|nr:membrane protein insertase YidC [Bacteroides cellulosilyticus]MCM1351646.1 membrane protein insertase YidC [Alistipes senegalensis]
MDKKSIIGIIVVGLLFVGFVYLNGKEQQKYQTELAEWQARQDSLAAAQRPAGSVESAVQGDATAAAKAASNLATTPLAPERPAELVGVALADAATAEPEEFAVENDAMTVRFSTRGGRIVGVTLKNYTKYAPRDERTEAVELFDPATARFGLTFHVRNGLNSVPVNTMDYTFSAPSVTVLDDGSQAVEMRLAVADGASLVYRYVIRNGGQPADDYTVDFDVRLEGMASVMSNQTAIGIDWSNTSYQNERGFKNENMYTTLSYRIPGEQSIEDLGMGDGTKSEEIATSVNWVAFKQQYFSSVFIAPKNVASAKLSFETAQPGSGYIKHYSARMTVPYAPQTDAYDFAFYFGPNQYSILRKVAVDGDDALHLERLVPLGWGIFGWINRWVVIPVFDFLRNYIASFGVIILLLVVLVKLVLSPITYKSYVSMAKMRLLKPQMDELAKKYPKQEDAMKRQQATLELQRKAGINPLSGCIPMLLQLPILVALFRFFPSSIELRGQSLWWSDDLSAYDSVLNLPFSIPFYGDHVSLFALLMALSTFGYSYYSYQQSASSQPQMAGMKFMMLYFMPLMMLCWFNDYASGLCFYYLLFNLFTIAQTLIIRRFVSDDKIQAIMAANAAKKSNGKKSKFQQRYEELLRQQEAQQRARRK